jgi:hypothetical protein
MFLGSESHYSHMLIFRSKIIDQVGVAVKLPVCFLKVHVSNFDKDTGYCNGFYVVLLTPARKMLG